MKYRKKIILYLVLILTSGIILNSCKKEIDGIVPVIPPASSMKIDFSGISMKKDGAVNITNWQYSAISIALWNTFLNVNCAIPLTAFEKVVEQKAISIGNNSWQWNSKFSADSVFIHARLQGEIDNDSVNWKLFITTTKQGVTYNDFLWVEGKSSSDQTGGWWLLYENQNNPIPYLKIFWTNKGDNLATTKCIFLKQNDPSTGDFIENGSLYNSIFEKYYVIRFQNNNIINIELNKSSKEGRLKSEFIFNDSNWHCWNSSLENVDCGN